MDVLRNCHKRKPNKDRRRAQEKADDNELTDSWMQRCKVRKSILIEILKFSVMGPTKTILTYMLFFGVKFPFDYIIKYEPTPLLEKLNVINTHVSKSIMHLCNTPCPHNLMVSPVECLDRRAYSNKVLTSQET